MQSLLVVNSLLKHCLKEFSLVSRSHAIGYISAITLKMDSLLPGESDSPAHQGLSGLWELLLVLFADTDVVAVQNRPPVLRLNKI